MRPRPDEDHELLCDLTEDELELKANQLAEVVKKSEQLAEDKKAAATVFKQREDAIKGAAGSLSGEILTKKERRAVLCRWRVETVGTTVGGTLKEEWVLRRGDTGEIVQRAPVTVADRQGEMFASETY